MNEVFFIFLCLFSFSLLIFYYYKKLNKITLKIEKRKSSFLEEAAISLVGWSARRIEGYLVNEYYSGETLFSFAVKKDFIQFTIYNPNIDYFNSSNPVRISFIEPSGKTTKPVEYNAKPIESGWSWVVPFFDNSNFIVAKNNIEKNRRLINNMWSADSMMVMVPKSLIESEGLSSKAISEPMFMVIHLNKNLKKEKMLTSVCQRPDI